MILHSFLVTPTEDVAHNRVSVIDYIDANVPLQDPPVVCELRWPPIKSNGRPDRALVLVVCRDLPDSYAADIAKLDGVDHLEALDTGRNLPDLKNGTKTALENRAVPSEVRDAKSEGALLNNLVQWLNPAARRVYPE